MKKSNICIILLLSVFLATAQDQYSEIKYFFKINNGSSPVILDCALLHNSSKNQSTFINFGFNSVPDETKTKIDDINGDSFVNIDRYDDNGGQKPEYQKNFLENTLVSHESVYGEKKYHLIDEKIPQFNWVIQKDTLTILNQKTQKATLNFRGRNYFAWFTTDIQISDGPYKFHGLPGLILKIESVDKKFTFEAYSIKLNIKKTDLSIKKLADKYPQKKQITIKEKVRLIKENTEKERKYKLSKNPGVVDIKIEHSGIELKYDDILNER
jgi:GLPGLI family protein